MNSGGLVSSALILKMIQPEVKEMALKYEYLYQIVQVLSQEHFPCDRVANFFFGGGG